MHIDYDLAYENALETSKSCCMFLTRMVGLMSAWDWLVKEQHKRDIEGRDRLFPGSMAFDTKDPNRPFDLINYHTTVDPPESTLPDIMALIHAYCGKNHEEDTYNKIRDYTQKEIERVRRYLDWDRTLWGDIMSNPFSLFIPIPSADPARMPAMVR